MSDHFEDWEKKYWQQKTQQAQQAKNNPQDLPHYEPAHVTQDKQRAQQPSTGWIDVDPLTAMYTNADGMASRGMGPQVQTVTLREGAAYYRPVQADNFGSSVPMVRSCGSFNGVKGREFEMRSECQCYLIDNLEVVDLSQINPQRMLRLIEIRAPFIGTILVEERFLVCGGNDGPQILKG
jgi:hypothetical protein